MDLERHTTRWSGVSRALVLLGTTVGGSVAGERLEEVIYLVQGPGFVNKA